MRPPRRDFPAASVGIASQNPSRERISGSAGVFAFSHYGATAVNSGSVNVTGAGSNAIVAASVTGTARRK